MSAKHTPGPWLVSEGKRDRVLMVYADGGGMAVIVNDAGRRPTAQQRADARLIAAAPELLRALRALMEEHGALSGAPASDSPAEAAARAAIAKAEGR